MLSRRHFPAVSRLLTVAAAAIAALGVVDCSTYALGSRKGASNGTLAAGPAGRAMPRAHASLSEVLLGSDGTYIGRLLADRDSTIERWPDRIDEPLRVWIDSSGTIDGTQAAFPAAVREAFTQWALTGIPMRFVFVPHAPDADIRVVWTDHLDRKTGSTTWRTDRAGWLTSSEITLATHISNGLTLDARGMRAIALHEVGHALGLSHSSDAHDIMAPLVRVDGLSEPDRTTIKKLYSLPAGHIR